MKAKETPNFPSKAKNRNLDSFYTKCSDYVDFPQGTHAAEHSPNRLLGTAISLSTFLQFC